jgi:peptide/nickel transport system ATP-binding protein
MMPTTQPLVTVEHLRKHYPVRNGLFAGNKSFIHAVDDISFEIGCGESVGLVGESGCGKTTTGKALVKLVDPSSGHIYMGANGTRVDVASLAGSGLKQFRRKVQMIFQDPYESMNPRLTIYDTVAEPLVVQNMGTLAEREELVVEVLALVGLTPPSSFMFRFPHELSGGQRQRVAIARALVVQPSFVVADEPTSMLDVSIRTGIMHLMLDLAQRMNVTYLYITHDLAVARYMCHRIAVMYLGKIIELGETEELLNHPQHPYTQALLASVPVPDPKLKREQANIKGGIPTPIDPPAYCRFYERCPRAAELCRVNEHPSLEEHGSGHWIACYRV